MNIFITASNELYRDVCNYNCYCAKRYGEFDKVVVYDVDKEIDETYRQHHANILSVKRGAGLWLWKVYFIDKALKEECSEGISWTGSFKSESKKYCDTRKAEPKLCCYRKNACICSRTRRRVPRQ